MTTTVVATLTNKFSATQPSNATVGTIVASSGSYQVRFSQEQPSTSFVGTIGELSETFTNKFSQVQPSTGSIGALASASMVVTSLPQSGDSQMLIGTTVTSSSIVYGMFESAKPADMQIGTILTLSATQYSLFETYSPPIFNRTMLNDGNSNYSESSSALFMTKQSAGNTNNKVRFVIDVGELKRIDKMQISSGESNASGNQKVKKVLIYAVSQPHVKTDSQLNNFGVAPGVQVGSMEWSSTSATQNETTIRKST